MFNKILTLALLFSVSPTLSACGGGDEDGGPKVEQSYPKILRDERREKRGKLFGEGISLLGDDKPVQQANNLTGGVNAYLWRASIDVINFMPLASVDAIGGIIITDWYESPNAKGERIKANVNISSKDLRASGVDVSLFKQKYSGSRWRDSKASDKLESQLEDKILARARELKIKEGRK